MTILIYVLVCEQYIRECCTGSCAGTELVRYRWLNLTNLSYRVYVAFITVAYIYFFLSFFSPPALSCCVLASGTIPWAVLHSPRTGLLIPFTLPAILLLYLFSPTLLCLPAVTVSKVVSIFSSKMFRYIRPNSSYLYSSLSFCITGGGIFIYLFDYLF